MPVFGDIGLVRQSGKSRSERLIVRAAIYFQRVPHHHYRQVAENLNLFGYFSTASRV
jgi:hypothetical protein